MALSKMQKHCVRVFSIDVSLSWNINQNLSRSKFYSNKTSLVEFWKSAQLFKVVSFKNLEHKRQTLAALDWTTPLNCDNVAFSINKDKN